MAGRAKLKECVECKELFVLGVQEAKREYTCALCSELWVAKIEEAKARELHERQARKASKQASKQMQRDFFLIMKVFGLKRGYASDRRLVYQLIKYLASIFTPTPEKEHETLIWVCSVLKTYTK